ncbi:MAG: methyltransferase domain-containing protein [Candidatus Brocadiia bacterium]
MKYPLFRKPDSYLRNREGGPLRGALKRAAERRALGRCLDRLRRVRTLCDAPCGPGRLFRFWRRRGLRVSGVDLSGEMVEAARAEAHRLGLEGAVRQADAFQLPRQAGARPDVVACVRFAYYFPRSRRIELLRGLARASRRYVLVEYKTSETLKGRRNLARHSERKPYLAKHFCTYDEMRRELAEAGLRGLAIVPIGPFSDRAFVLAERRPAGAPPAPAPVPVLRHPRRAAVAAAALLLASLSAALLAVLGEG